MQSRGRVCSLIGVLMLVGVTAGAQEIKVAVLPTQFDDSAKGKVPALLDDYYLTAVQNLGGMEVVGKDDIEALIGFEGQKDLLGCDDASCIANIGGALGVDKLVVIKVARLGSDWVATGKLINIKETRVEQRVSRFVSGDAKALFQDAAPLVEELFGRRGPQAPGGSGRPAPTPPPSGAMKPPPPLPAGATGPGISVQASTGWALAGAIMGFASVGLTLVLGVTSGLATCGDLCNSTLAQILGASATTLFAVMTPITYVAGRTPRKHPDVHGVTALRIIGWITYGIMITYDLALLGVSFAADVPAGPVYVAALGSAAGTGFMAIDTLVAYFQAKHVIAKQAPSAAADDVTIVPLLRMARERDNSGAYPVVGLAMTF